MDRFIVMSGVNSKNYLKNLKSNMDRFIVAIVFFVKGLKLKFKIQYG